MSKRKATDLFFAVINFFAALPGAILRCWLRTIAEMYEPVSGFERSVAGLTLSVYLGAAAGYFFRAFVGLPLFIAICAGILALGLSYFFIFPAFYVIVWRSLRNCSNMLWDRVELLERFSSLSALLKGSVIALLLGLSAYSGYLVAAAFFRDLGALDNFFSYLALPAALVFGTALALLLSAVSYVLVDEIGMPAIATVSGLLLLALLKAQILCLLCRMGLDAGLNIPVFALLLGFYYCLLFPLLFLGVSRLIRLLF